TTILGPAEPNARACTVSQIRIFDSPPATPLHGSPVPPPKFGFDPLDGGARSESPYPGNDLHRGDVTVPITEEPAPGDPKRLRLRQTPRRHHVVRPPHPTDPPEALRRLATGAAGRYK